jgi:hypothetical protein
LVVLFVVSFIFSQINDEKSFVESEEVSCLTAGLT